MSVIWQWASPALIPLTFLPKHVKIVELKGRLGQLKVERPCFSIVTRASGGLVSKLI